MTNPGDLDMHQAYLILGSNIDPIQNTRRALDLLAERVQIRAISNCWETRSVGYDGPNFINVAVWVLTCLEKEELKNEVLSAIERELGRVRTGEKSAPRTIDLDIIVFDGVVVDAHLWEQAFVAAPMAELLPDLLYPQSGKTLREVAKALRKESYAVPRPELLKT